MAGSDACREETLVAYQAPAFGDIRRDRDCGVLDLPLQFKLLARYGFDATEVTVRLADAIGPIHRKTRCDSSVIKEDLFHVLLEEPANL